MSLEQNNPSKQQQTNIYAGLISTYRRDKEINGQKHIRDCYLKHVRALGTQELLQGMLAWWACILIFSRTDMGSQDNPAQKGC